MLVSIRKSHKLALAGVVLISLVLFVLAPRWQVYQLYKAVERNDADIVISKINFPALKASVRDEVIVALTPVLAGIASPTSGGGGASAQTAHVYIDVLLDTLITPANVKLLLKEGNGAFNPELGQGQTPAPAVSSGYSGVNSYTVTVTHFEDKTKWVSFIFNREGLTTWTLSGVKLPTQSLANFVPKF